MKTIRKTATLALALLLIFECFAGTAMATTDISNQLKISEQSVSMDAMMTLIDDSEPEPSEPEASEPEPSEPEPSEPEPSEPEITEPTVVESGKCGDNLTWSLDSEGLLTISGKGAMKNYSKSSPAPWSGKDVKNVIFSAGITSVGNYAFYQMNLKACTLPDSLKTIGSYAFAQTSLDDIVIPEKVTKIGSYAFNACDFSVLYIPDSVTSMGEGAFFSCSKLEIVYISRSLKTIDERVFQYCAQLKLVIMPGSVTRVEAWAFCDCDALNTVYYLGTESQLKKISISTGNSDLETSQWYWYTVPTKEPTDVKTIAGKTVTFSTAASRSGCSFQWYYLYPNATSWTKCSGKTAASATYSFTAKASLDGYQYACVITDKYGNMVETAHVTLTIVPAPKITKEPESVTVKYGEPVSVSVEAEGEGLKYQWYYAAKGAKKFSKASITKATYATTMNSDRDGRKLYCVVTDKFGQTVKTQTVTINLETTPLVLLKQPESITVKYGQKSAVTVEAEGDGLTYQWYYAAKGAKKFKKASITKATYSVSMDASRDGRQLYCVVKDKYGKSVKTEVVTINLEKTPLQIVTQPVNGTAAYGKKAAVTVEAQGNGLTYQWYYAAKGAKKFKKASITKATYSVSMDMSREGRQLYCVVKDIYGNSVKTDTVTISIERKELSIVTQPVSVSVKNGKKANVTVVAEGDGLTYQWYYAAKGSKKFKKASITKATYSVEMDSSRNGRQLYCVVKDAYGNSVKTDIVTISKK